MKSGILPTQAAALPVGRVQADRIDALKGVACTLIVWHHLAAYGPMSDVVHLAAPGLINWLYDNARMAVQVFLVVGGFLSAGAMTRNQVASHAAGPEHSAHPISRFARQILQRFSRLAPAYWVALLVSVAVSAALRPWFEHPSVPDAPTWFQAAAHALLLHDVLGQSALSAGIWYIAIDLQLFALAALVCGLAWRSGTSFATARRVAMAGTFALAALSLLVFNRQSALDITALYFFGAYGLGMLAFWATQLTNSRERLLWVGLLTAASLLALWVDFRARIALALTVALALVWLQQTPDRAGPGAALRRAALAPLAWLGKRSYAIFLIHFPVCLVFNAVLAQAFPAQWWANALGMVAAFGSSVLAGMLLHRHVEVGVRRKSAVPALAVAAAGR